MKSGAWSRWIFRLAPVVASLGFGLALSVPAAAQSTVLFCVSDASIVRVEFTPGISSVFLNDLDLPASRGLDPTTPGPFVTRLGNTVVDYELIRRGQGWNLTTTRIRLPLGTPVASTGECRSIAALETLPRMLFKPVPLSADAGSPPLEAIIAAADPVAGAAAAGQCAGCHTFTGGGPHGFGPNLWDVIGSPAGGKPRFAYSPAMQAQNAAGETWTLEHFDAFIHNPQDAVPGTTMPFGGVADDTERHDIVAYFRTLSNDPVPLPAAAAVAPVTAETPAITLAFEDVGNPTLLTAVANGDVAAGEQVAMQCAGCHSLGEGEANRFGPNLYGLVYRVVGTHDGFTYSPALAALGGQGAVWTYTGLDAFLTNPQVAIPGNTMPFGGIADAAQRANLIAYLRSLAAAPTPAAATSAAIAVDTTMLLGDWAPDAATCSQGIVMTVGNNGLGGAALGVAQCVINTRTREGDAVTVVAACSSPDTAFRSVTMTLSAVVVNDAPPARMTMLQQGDGLAEAATLPIDLIRCAAVPTL